VWCVVVCGVLWCGVGRPVEEDAWYDRCAQAVWRLACHPTSEGRTLILVTHGG
jgi:hypothetical protein